MHVLPSADELRTIFLEDDVRELRNQLSTEKSKNTRLMRVVERVAKQKRCVCAAAEPAWCVLCWMLSSLCMLLYSIEQSDAERLSHGSEAHLPANHRPSTLQECESIIKHLQLKNDKQGHEVSPCVKLLLH